MAYTDREQFRGKQHRFTFSVMDVLHEVTNVLTRAQCCYLLILQCYVGYGVGHLMNPDKSLMKTNDMRRVLLMDDRRKKSSFYNFLDKAVSNGFIIENGDGSYSINERYHFRGKASTGIAVLKAYTAKIKKINGNVRPEDLGLIYMMLPLVHYSTNTLCSNPGEEIPEKVHALSRHELAEAIGISAKNRASPLSIQ
jgi:hypothetical protein